jgi:hypothetical protein
MRNTADVTGGKPIAVLLLSISGVGAINPLVAFYDIHGGKIAVLVFYYVPDTTRDQDELRNFDSGSLTSRPRKSKMSNGNAHRNLLAKKRGVRSGDS